MRRFSIVMRYRRCVLPLLVACLAASDAAPAAAKRPNFVLCLADDLGFGDVGFTGNADVRTPVLDEMARTAVRFDRFYAAASVCSPTRGSFLTGRHPVRYGVFSWGWSLRPAEITLAEVLKPAGYATGHFGKWHLGSMAADGNTSPGAQGFEQWASSPNFYENDPLFSRRGKVVRMQGESSAVTVDAALEFIEAAVRAERPFAAVVWFGNPHTPHEAIQELRNLYPDAPKNLQNYWGETTGIDRAMGRLRARLRELKVADDTLLLFTSDNGAAAPGSTGGLKGKKGTLWEGGIRVPAVLEWPARVKGPRVVVAPCGTVDVLPTVLAAAGVDYPQAGRPLDGENVLPLVEGEATQRTKPLGFWTYPMPGKPMRSTQLLEALEQSSANSAAGGAPTDDEAELHAKRYPENERPGHAAWIDGRWKLHFIPADGREPALHLFDLVADPQETTDLAASERSRVERMAGDLEAWQRSVLHSLNGADDRR